VAAWCWNDAGVCRRAGGMTLERAGMLLE